MRSSSFRMSPVFIALFTLFASTFRTRTALQAEIAALRHQIAVLQLRAPRRLRLKQSDRFPWILWSWVWPEWRRWLRSFSPTRSSAGIGARSLAIGRGSRAEDQGDRRWLSPFAT